MNPTVILEFINLFCSGMVAGSLFVIHYGVRTPVSLLDERSQIQMRQALIHRLRVVIPATFLPTVLSGVAVAILDWSGSGFIFRCAGVLSLLACILITLLGTVPINKATLTWQPNTPPKTWRIQVSRWERFDTTRTWAAVASFALLLTAMAFRLASR
jgi:uncharacterized membrane protein